MNELLQGRTKALGRRLGVLLALAAVFCLPSLAQYTAPYVSINGTLSSANGMPASNYLISFTPSQVMFVGGTSVVVSGANCGTDVNGAVVGTPNPTVGATTTWLAGQGTLPTGNYYIEVTWADAAGHQTLPSPEVQQQLSATGELVVIPPANGTPLSAVEMNVYIATSSGAETYQGQVPAGSSYDQTVPLVTGAALPITNNTVCQVIANDAAWPIGGYSMNVTSPSGNTVPGFPVLVQVLGPGSSYNLSNGIPAWNGRLTYPVPVLAVPYNHNAQSISSPLSMTSYSIYNIGRLGVGTAVPAYGIDVEGAGAAAAVNAQQGYLVNGGAGTSGQCLSSDGTYYDTPRTCISALPIIYYQAVAVNAAAMPPRSTLNFIGAGAAAVSCVDNAGFNRTDCTVSSSDQFWSTALPTCSTTAGCANTINLPVAYADTNYVVICWPNTSSFSLPNVTISGVGALTASSFPTMLGVPSNAAWNVTAYCHAHHF